MKLEKALKDLGFGDPVRILVNIGRPRLLKLFNQMFVGIEPSYIYIWKSFYGIGNPPKSLRAIGEQLNPVLDKKKVAEIRHRTTRMLMYKDRIQILSKEVTKIPKQKN